MNRIVFNHLIETEPAWVIELKTISKWCRSNERNIFWKLSTINSIWSFPSIVLSGSSCPQDKLMIYINLISMNLWRNDEKGNVARGKTHGIIENEQVFNHLRSFIRIQFDNIILDFSLGTFIEIHVWFFFWFWFKFWQKIIQRSISKHHR